VEAGDTVTAGTQLFTEGATGNVTGTHLHFEIIEGTWNDPWAPPYNNGANFVDPLPVLRDHGVNI
jgi:murein DD-endopeptidase MepM/ murein hydrolase activator NlpD